MLASTSTGRRFSTSNTPAVLCDVHNNSHAHLQRYGHLLYNFTSMIRMLLDPAGHREGSKCHLIITNGWGAALSCIVSSSRIASCAPDADAGRPKVAMAHVSPVMEARGHHHTISANTCGGQKSIGLSPIKLRKGCGRLDCLSFAHLSGRSLV